MRRRSGSRHLAPVVAAALVLGLVATGCDGDGLDDSGLFGDAPGESSGVCPFPGAVSPVRLEPGGAARGIDFAVSEQQNILDEEGVRRFAPVPRASPAPPPAEPAPAPGG